MDTIKEKSQTLEDILEKANTLGDLPVFSTTVNRICAISADPDADAMELAQQIMNDANLSLKMLKLANSSYYNRSHNKISVVSRSVVLLGFDTIKNLCLTVKLIESFQHERPGIDMDTLLVQAYIAAGFARDLAVKSGVRDIEETYICALLHNLGEVCVAYFLPDKFTAIQQRNKEIPGKALQNEKAVLGVTMAEIGRELASSWNFSNKVVATMNNDLPKLTAGVAKAAEFNHIMASLGSTLVGALYETPKYRNYDFNDTLMKLSKAIGLSLGDVEDALSQSFKMSCALAREYGLNKKKITPPVDDTNDEARDRIARQLSYFVSSDAPAPHAEDQNEVPPEQSQLQTSASEQPQDTQQKHPPQDAKVDQFLQLQYIQDITALITDTAGFNVVLGKVLEGLREAVGFERVALAVLSVDRKRYSVRVSLGEHSEGLKTYLDRPIVPTKDLFSQMIKDGMDLVISDLTEPRWQNALPEAFHSTVGARGFLASALRSGMRPLGFVYADNGAKGDPVSSGQQRGFVQFIAQARLALQTNR